MINIFSSAIFPSLVPPPQKKEKLSGSVIFPEITWESRFITQYIWGRVVGYVLVNIFPLQIVSHKCFPRKDITKIVRIGDVARNILEIKMA